MTDKLWITIDPSPFRQQVKEKIGTATVVTSTSPYTVPQAIAAYDDKIAGQYVVEVKYIGPEEPLELWPIRSFQPASPVDSSRVMLGKNSGRLFKLFISHQTESMQRQEFVKAIKSALTDLISGHEQGPVENYNIVGKVFEQNLNRILSGAYEAPATPKRSADEQK